MKKSGLMFVITAFLLLIICIIALGANIFSTHGLIGEFVAALLGVIITAVITLILLDGQTKNDVKRDQEVITFQEQIKIYRDFLNQLHNLLNIKNDNKSYKEKITDLQFSIANLALIKTKSLCIKNISREVKELNNLYISDDHLVENKNQEILTHLFMIVSYLRENLYKMSMNEYKKDDIDDAIQNFTEIFNLDIEPQNEDDGQIFETVIDNETNEIWNVVAEKEQKRIYSKTFEDKTIVISVKKSANKSWYFKVEMKDSDKNSRYSLYNKLYQEIGGRYNVDETWWMYFPHKYDCQDNIVGDVEEYLNDTLSSRIKPTINNHLKKNN